MPRIVSANGDSSGSNVETVAVEPQVLPAPTIVLGQGAAACSSRQAVPTTVVVGQQISFTACVPSGVAPTSESWTQTVPAGNSAGGTYYLQVVPSTDGSGATFLASAQESSANASNESPFAVAAPSVTITSRPITITPSSTAPGQYVA